MKTINEQLNIPTLPEGKQGYMPNLYNGNRLDAGRGYDNTIIAGDVYRHADGSGWSNAYGVSYPALIYPTCMGTYKEECRQCKDMCKDTKGLKWRDGGKECFVSCFETKVLNKKAVVLQNSGSGGGLMLGGLTVGAPTDGGVKTTTSTEETTTETNPKTGMSTGMKVGIGVGAVAVIGIAVWYFKFRKK